MVDYTVVAFGVVLIIAVGDYLLDGKNRFKLKGARPPVVDDEGGTT